MRADSLPGPEDAEGRQHDPHHHLERVLGNARERSVDDQSRRYHHHNRGQRTERCQTHLVLRGSKRHDDERDLEPFEQDTLERHCHPGTVESWCRSCRSKRRDLVREDLIFVVQGFETARSKNRLPQPLETEHQEQGTNHHPQGGERQLREQRAEGKNDHEKGSKATCHTYECAAPSLGHADGQNDGQGFDHLDQACSKARPEQQDVFHRTMVTHRPGRSVGARTLVCTVPKSDWATAFNPPVPSSLYPGLVAGLSYNTTPQLVADVSHIMQLKALDHVGALSVSTVFLLAQGALSNPLASPFDLDEPAPEALLQALAQAGSGSFQIVSSDADLSLSGTPSLE